MNYCGDCGNKLEENEIFCGKCGVKLFKEEENKLEPKIIAPDKPKKINKTLTKDFEFVLDDKYQNDNEIKDNPSRLKSSVKISLKNFNRKQPLYQKIRWTLIALFWIDLFAEMIYRDYLTHNGEMSNSAPANIIPIFITFWIARYFMRVKFIKNPNFENKIIITVGVFLAIYIGKIIIAGIILISIS